MTNSSRSGSIHRTFNRTGLRGRVNDFWRFRNKITRFAPHIGYHHVLMTLLLFPIVMLSVLLAGCTSNGMSDIYLMSLRYNAYNYTITKGEAQSSSMIAQAVQNVTQTGNGTTFEVRAAYMGICVGQRDEDRICSSSAKALANMIGAERRTILVGNSSITTMPDPLNLIMIAEEFRRKIVFDGLIYIAIVMCLMCFITLSTMPGWHEEDDAEGSERQVKPFPARSVSHFSLITSVLGFGFGFVSVLWQHINSSSTATMAEILTYGAVEGHVGSAAMALGWISVFAVAFVAIGIVIMIISISLLVRLLEKDDDSSASSTSTSG